MCVPAGGAGRVPGQAEGSGGGGRSAHRQNVPPAAGGRGGWRASRRCLTFCHWCKQVTVNVVCASEEIYPYYATTKRINWKIVSTSYDEPKKKIMLTKSPA
eukprot:1186790-Prorocentrum_minimum.AAC.1